MAALYVRDHDPSSLSNHETVVTTHVDLCWWVDFSAQTVRGRATFHCLALTDTTPELLLDAKALDVTKVTAPSGEPYDFTVVLAAEHDHAAVMGRGLRVDLSKTFGATISANTAFAVAIEYATTAEGTALCWLEKAQTAAKRAPFLYSQCQAIHARTLLPCQDTPGVRTTYQAVVHTKADVGAAVLMSALPADPSLIDTSTVPTTVSLVTPSLKDAVIDSTKTVTDASGATWAVYAFVQPIAIPSYLIAVAVGALAAKDVSPRCRVYAEPTEIAAAAEEFSDVERFVTTAEAIAGPYEWQRYDVIVMPPSFPYGGMENPCLTFVTPTCIAGDKSLVELVAHEVCHSWAGNLVGIAGWAHFWINEGFTVYLQRAITKRLDGVDVEDYEIATGLDHLQRDIDLFTGDERKWTAMRPAIVPGIDPDDVFSSVPYEKGFCFLKKLEALVGGDEPFQKWIREAYVPTFRRKPITSADVQRCFTAAFPDAAAKVDWEGEFTAVGPVTDAPVTTGRLRAVCNEAADAVLTQGPAAPLFTPTALEAARAWQGRHQLAFLERLKERTAATAPLAEATLEPLDAAFGYNVPMGAAGAKNAEVLYLWYALCCGSAAAGGRYRAFVTPMTSFLRAVGRMKFARPLMRHWASVDLPAANAFFAERGPAYHGITRKMVAKDLTNAATGKAQ